MSGPLSGIKIIDLTTVLMGPYATRILGDLGADIVKIESLGGDVIRYANRGRSAGMSNLFLNNNRNKRSLALDLKHEAGHEVLMRLVANSDVLVSNMRPQAMNRLGLSYKDIANVNDSIVYASCIGFGQQGPYANRRAYDDLIQAMSGIPSMMERAYGGEPRFAPSNFCDRVTGLSVVYAVTAALFHRERTGEGQAIEIPMYETMVDFMMSDHLGGYTFVPTDGPSGYERIINANRRPYKTTDGYIALLVYTDEQWKKFLEIAGRQDLVGQGIFATMNVRADNAIEVYGFVDSVIAKKSTSEWLEIFSGSDLVFTVVPKFDDLFDDEHLNAVDFFREVEHSSEGTIRTTNIASQWSISQPDIRSQAPRLGEHSAEVLRELGYSNAEIDTLIASQTTICAENR